VGTVVLVVSLLILSVALKIISNVVKKANVDTRDKNLYMVPLWISRVCMIALVLSFVMSTVRVIAAGHVGVATLFGQVQPAQLTEGIHFVNPLLSVTEMSTQVQ
jgi:hypothetical protein